MKKNQLLWLGVFIVGGLTVVIAGIFFLSGKEKIFERTFSLYVPFDNVAGLRAGAAVRLSGIDIGVVESIRLPEAPGGRVTVTLRLDREAQDLIKNDALAVIETEGLVGSKIVSIIGGSLAQPHVVDGSSIGSRSPIDFGAILVSFDETAHYMRLVTQSLDGITRQISSGQGTVGKIVYDEELYHKLLAMTLRTDSVFADLQLETQQLGEILKTVSNSTDSLVAHVRAGKGTLGRMLYRDDLHDLAMASMQSMRDSVNALLADVRRGQGLTGKLIADTTLAVKLDSAFIDLAVLQQQLYEISRLGRIGVFSFTENMEALKHNWFFKGYFERRGFWNEAEFEQEYEKRKQELAAYDKELKAQEQILDMHFRQLKSMQKMLDERQKQLEKMEKSSSGQQ
jgi:phospholipid/cholesterol/gamma-HCH transport system substrate-binding protein